MDNVQDDNTAESGPSRLQSTPESLLFVNTTLGSEAPQALQASMRQRARSHIMHRYHKKTRELRGTGQHLPGITASLPHAGRLPDGGRLDLMGSSSVPTSRIRSTMDYFQPGIVLVAAQDPLNGFHKYDERVGYIQERNISIPFGIDPFSTISFPFQLDHRDRNLLFHYSAVFNYTNMPVNSKVEWMRVAVADDALLHTTLIISALRLAILRGKDFSLDAFRHDKEVVKIINDRLNNPLLRSLDSTILCIASLALIEVVHASPLSAMYHTAALKQLIADRGGLATLGVNGLVRRQSLWADLSSAIARDTTPHLPFSSIELPIPCPPNASVPVVDTSARNVCAEIATWVSKSQYPSDVETIMRKLQHLSLVLSSLDRTNMVEVDQLNLSDHFYDLERRAYDLRLENLSYLPSVAQENSTNKTPTALLFSACCLTIIIYISLALREVAPRAGLFSPLIGRLTTMLRNVDVAVACNMYPKTLLWILSTGCIAAVGREEREWYVKWLDHLCETKKIYEWHVMRTEFNSCVHVTPGYMTEFMEVWNDVEEVRLLKELS